MVNTSNPSVRRAQPAVLRYPGSKWSLAPTIADHFGPHHHYVEPYFGSGAVFFTKEPSPHEVINDASESVVNLWRMLRTRTDDLCWALETTPWSRAEYEHSDEPSGDDLEDARRFVVRVWQAHGSDTAKKTGWKARGSHQRAGGMSHRWQKLPHQLRALAWRLSDAEIENRDALDVIARHHGADVLIYADPPYLSSTRTQRVYAHETDARHHHDLLVALNAHPGPVLLSGYESAMYQDALVGWDRVHLKPPKVEKGAARTEILWVKSAVAP